jgi:cysteine dioxygenase
VAHRLRQRLLASPAAADRALARDEMLAFARAVDLDTLDLAEYRKFDETRYARNTVFLNERVELVVICWRADQASSIHDHGRSNCLYLVVDGEMQEELFAVNDEGRPRRALTRRFRRGDITLAGPADIHRIANLGEGDLVTVHIYSPPLDDSMTNYTPIPVRQANSQAR